MLVLLLSVISDREDFRSVGQDRRIFFPQRQILVSFSATPATSCSHHAGNNATKL
jgi:hypothetical protein